MATTTPSTAATTIEIFVDAGINPPPSHDSPGFGGFGVCFWSAGTPHQENSRPGWRGLAGSLGKRDNQDIAEIQAISKGLLFFLDVHRRFGADFAPGRFSRLVIWSDSKNALQDIERGRWSAAERRGWEVENVVERILSVERMGVEVRLEWVRGHSGVPGNEFADTLARRGREICVKEGGRDGGVEYFL